MRLLSLGALTTDPANDHLGSQPLLLLCYVLLEKTRSKAELAQLFWAHLADEVTPKGERKDLKNLGVCLALLKRELGISIDDETLMDSFSCDSLELEQAFQHGAWEQVLELYRRGHFLAELEHKPRLNLSSELYSWLMSRRERIAQQARDACLNLIEQSVKAGNFTSANELMQNYSNSLLKLSDLEEQEPALLARLYHLFLSLGQAGASQVRQAFEGYLNHLLAETLLSQEALHVLLALSLQADLNLVAVQRSLSLSPKQMATCREELIRVKLLGANSQVLAKDITNYYLEQHPGLKTSLLLGLLNHTAEDQVLFLFRSIYQATQTFGGIGYWSKALAVYTSQAQNLIAQDKFEEAFALLSEFKQAEEINQGDPSHHARFLLAYCLERLGRYKEGLEALEGVSETDDIRSIRALFLLKAGQLQEAKELALAVREKVLSSHLQSWARAIAANVLGQIAYEENLLHDAESYFDEAAVQWQAAQMPKRVLGALMNRANVFESLGEKERALETYKQVISASGPFPALKIHSLLNMGYLYEQEEKWREAFEFYQAAHRQCQNMSQITPALAARVHNNYGYSCWQTQQSSLAVEHINEAIRLALEAGERLTYAKALGNLALIFTDVGKMEASWRLFQEMGAQYELEQYRTLFVSALDAKVKASEATSDTEAFTFYERKRQLFLTPH